MVQQIVNIPEKDLSLFLELAKKMKWKVSEFVPQSIDFELNEEQLNFLKESSKAPNNTCLTVEESMQKLNDL